MMTGWRFRAWGACVVTAVAGIGCGSVTPIADADGGADAPAETGPASVQQGCMQEAQAICGALDSCAPFWVQLYYGDKPTCVSRFVLSCMTDQNVVGTQRSAADLMACADAVASASCPDLLASQFPPACAVKPGTVVNGADCGSDWQCQSTYCSKRGATCGICAPRAAASGDCSANDGCQDGLTCADSKCVQPAMAGDHCDATKQPCRSDLFCGADGKCAARVGAGGSCSATDQACDYTQGVACNPFTKTCDMVKVAKGGDACGIVNRTLTLCVSLGPCPGSTLLAPGVCANPAGDGEPCGDSAGGSKCLAPATCDMGICHLASTPSCQ